MKNKLTVVWLAAALAAAYPVFAAPAQVTTTAPIILKRHKPKLEKFKGQVMFATIASIIVQSSDNLRMIRTFQYSPEAREKMIAIISRGGYRHGDKVTVFTEPGSTVAVKIKGKPSK